MELAICLQQTTTPPGELGGNATPPAPSSPIHYWGRRSVEWLADSLAAFLDPRAGRLQKVAVDITVLVLSIPISMTIVGAPLCCLLARRFGKISVRPGDDPGPSAQRMRWNEELPAQKKESILKIDKDLLSTIYAIIAYLIATFSLVPLVGPCIMISSSFYLGQWEECVTQLQEDDEKKQIREKKQNACDTLDIQCDASPQEVKQAYRKLIRQCHPDRIDGQNERAQQINEAYALLSKRPVCEVEAAAI